MTLPRVAAQSKLSDLRGTAIPLDAGYGVRHLTVDSLAQAMAAGGILFLVASFVCFLVYGVGRNEFVHASWMLGVGTECAITGSLLLSVRGFNLDWAMRHAAAIIHGVLFVAGIGITTLLYAAGVDRFMLLTVIYLEPLIFACYLLNTRYALAHIMLLGVQFFFLTHFTEPIEHPTLQWMLLNIIGVSGAFLLGRQGDSAAALAESEFAAHTALAEVNATLEQRVAEQVGELERLGRLRRFLSGPVADAVATDASELLAPHRRPIAVFFCDLRGFTSFAANAEPEDVVEVLGEYYATVGRHLDAHKATVGSFAGDGVMAYFGDPLPVDNPALAALDMAADLASELDALVGRWHRNGHELGYGIGITHGHATLGVVGYEGRSEYTALGSVVNLAARLSDQAAAGQVLLDGRAAAKIGESPRIRPAGDRTLKGMSHPVAVFELTR